MAPPAGEPNESLNRGVVRLGAGDWRGTDMVELAPACDHADISAIAAATVVQPARWRAGGAPTDRPCIRRSFLLGRNQIARPALG